VRGDVCRADDPDVIRFRDLLSRYAGATNSRHATELLLDWPRALQHFAKVSPAAVAPPPEPTAQRGTEKPIAARAASS
jgi:glutamate synthase domain-containing protein 3